VAERDPHGRGAHDLRRRDEHPLLELQHLGPGRADVDRQPRDREHQHDVEDRGLEHVEDDDGHEQGREAHDDVGQAQHEVAGPAARVAGEEPQGRADDERDATAAAAMVSVFRLARISRPSMLRPSVSAPRT
jgi:hypothetical protein